MRDDSDDESEVQPCPLLCFSKQTVTPDKRPTHVCSRGTDSSFAFFHGISLLGYRRKRRLRRSRPRKSWPRRRRLEVSHSTVHIRARSCTSQFFASLFLTVPHHATVPVDRLQAGTLVWTKFRDYPFWPSVVSTDVAATGCRLLLSL